MSPQRIETGRLKLIALDLALLDLSCINYGAVQSHLGANVTRQMHDPDMIYALREAHYKASCDFENHNWYTNWEMLNPELHIIIGSACFKGPPDESGMVEVGYEVDRTYRNQGYASEAVQALIQWAFTFDSVKGVIASVEPDNLASKGVLNKMGMCFQEASEELEWWLIEK